MFGQYVPDCGEVPRDSPRNPPGSCATAPYSGSSARILDLIEFTLETCTTASTRAPMDMRLHQRRRPNPPQLVSPWPYHSTFENVFRSGIVDACFTSTLDHPSLSRRSPLHLHKRVQDSIHRVDVSFCGVLPVIFNASTGRKCG